MRAGRLRVLTVGVPAIAVAALILGAAMEISFLESPAAGYCPEYGGFLQYCFFPPSEIATFTIWLALGLAGAGIASSIFAWRRRPGEAAAFALPGLIGVVLALLFAVGGQSPDSSQPLLNTPPAGYWMHEVGGGAAFVGLLLLGAACCLQLVVRFRRPT
jgi:hypothetical protein